MPVGAGRARRRSGGALKRSCRLRSGGAAEYAEGDASLGTLSDFDEDIMSTEHNKAVVRRVYEDIWTRGKFDLIPELFHADCVNEDPVSPGRCMKGREAVQARALLEKAERLHAKASAEDQAELDRLIGNLRTSLEWPESAGPK